MRRWNVDVAPRRVMAAVAHGALSRGASIAFFVGRDKLTGWDVARHAREIDAGFTRTLRIKAPTPMRRDVRLARGECHEAIRE